MANTKWPSQWLRVRPTRTATDISITSSMGKRPCLWRRLTHLLKKHSVS